MARPPGADSGETYDRILEATHHELRNTQPRNAISLRRVAERAGVGLGTLQYYFSNKDTLLEACLDGYYERLGALAAELFSHADEHATQPTVELVRHAMREHYRFVCREKALVELRLLTNAARGELHPSRQPHYMAQIIGHAAKLLSPRLGLSELDIRVSIQALSYSTVRMALLSPGELESLTGATGADAEAQIEASMVEAACRLLCPDRTTPEAEP